MKKLVKEDLNEYFNSENSIKIPADKADEFAKLLNLNDIEFDSYFLDSIYGGDGTVTFILNNEEDYEYVKNYIKESLNESFSVGGKLFREIFLKSCHALVKAGRVEEVKKIVDWAKKLKELGWPKLPELKTKIGEEALKKFEKGIIPFMERQLPSFGATPGGTVSGGKGGSIGKDDNERAEVIAKAIGMSKEEVLELIKK